MNKLLKIRFNRLLGVMLEKSFHQSNWNQEEFMRENGRMELRMGMES